MKHLFALLACTLVLTACGSSQQKERPLYSGENGVILSFPETNSFSQFSSDVFSIAVRLDNDGATHVAGTGREGVISATYDASLLAFNSLVLDSAVRTAQEVADGAPVSAGFFLNGRDEFVEQGDVTYAEFAFVARNLTGNREKATATVTFTACYPYETKFQQNICVDRDYYSQAQQVCTARTLLGTSQGAPIAVTRVEPRFNRAASTVQPQFVITLENLADGYVIYDEDHNKSTEVCQLQKFDRSLFGRALVDARLNNVQLRCNNGADPENRGIAKFEGTTATIVCKLETPIETGANYETPLFITLNYFYISTIAANVEIVK